MTESTLPANETAPYERLIAVLADNWWAIAVRGVLGILFGLVCLFLPAVTMLSLALLFGAYAFADGVFGIVAAVRSARAGERWGWLVFEGLANFAIAAVAFFWPGVTILTFVLLVAAWAILSGILMLAAALRVGVDDGRWWLVLSGIASLVYGIILVIAPMAGAVVLTWWLGAYALVFGVALLVFAFKLRGRARSAAS
ncbi:MAG: HdeD family acid-resistance protein [Reyranella sp.]|jgi:uncharacterized membrane protein HdeD (DUF308 family)|nr:HdeD family acid-resistance protein [Reyranella sp.]